MPKRHSIQYFVAVQSSRRLLDRQNLRTNYDKNNNAKERTTATREDIFGRTSNNQRTRVQFHREIPAQKGNLKPQQNTKRGVTA